MPHYKEVKNNSIFWIIFSALLILLSPCTVKKVVADAVGIGYEKPLNVSKTTIYSGGNTCHYSEFKTVVKSTTLFKKQSLFPLINPQQVFFTLIDLHCQYETACNEQRKNITAKAPLYILYKKLKYSLLA